MWCWTRGRSSRSAGTRCGRPAPTPGPRSASWPDACPPPTSSRPDQARRLDAIVRDAIYAQKALARGKRWEAVAAVERIRRSLTDLRGRRDGLRLDPADPAGALATVLAEVQTDYHLGLQRRALLGSQDPDGSPGT